MTHQGEHPPGKCRCGSQGKVCCTSATYEDGSTDNPTCEDCCPIFHQPHNPDRVDAKID